MNSNHDFKKTNVLVVEDSLSMRLLIRRTLSPFKFKKIEDAPDASTALRVLGSFRADLIITCWEMDPMDGIEFTKLVRTAKDGRNHFVPIIMLTGFAQLERVIQARDAGVTEFLAKPFSTESLYSRIVSIVDHPRAFIRCKTYVGPDRRRRELGPRDGIADRRKAAVDAGGAMPAPEKI